MATIKLRNASLEFPVIEGSRSLRHAMLQRTGGKILRGGGHKRAHVQALDNIDLDINEGDRVGLVGHNGAGKSSLLKVMAGVYELTSGNLAVNGTISSIFNTTIGVDLEETGYDNIFNIGLFLGMSRKEVDAKLDDIAEFCELGEFLNMPLKTYSSGMLLRLTFATATATNPEILLLDEWLFAGDLRFAEKAEKRLNTLLNRSNILVVASHSIELVLKYCNKGIMMEQGQIAMIDTPQKVLEVYYSRYHGT